jgi:hypothetical protein
MLIDKIIKPGAILNENELDMPVIRDWFSRSFVLRCTNVSEYMKTHEKDTYNIYKDFPNVAPSFDNMWFEWTVDGITEDGRHEICRMGLLLNSCDKVKHPDAECWTREFKGNLTARWAVNAYLFAFGTDPSKALYMTHNYWGVNGDGSFTDHRFVKNTPSGPTFGSFAPGISISASEGWKQHLRRIKATEEHAAESGLRYLGVPLMAMCFLHCKNVTVQKSEPHSPHTVKAYRKMGKPLYRYHTISIVPNHQIGKGVGHHGPNAAAAIHICRGHFKTFTADKPLLGKHTGIYWWGMQVRGRKESGVVMKEYSVEPEKSI